MIGSGAPIRCSEGDGRTVTSVSYAIGAWNLRGTCSSNALSAVVSRQVLKCISVAGLRRVRALPLGRRLLVRQTEKRDKIPLPPDLLGNLGRERNKRIFRNHFDPCTATISWIKNEARATAYAGAKALRTLFVRISVISLHASSFSFHFPLHFVF